MLLPPLSLSTAYRLEVATAALVPMLGLGIMKAEVRQRRAYKATPRALVESFIFFWEGGESGVCAGVACMWKGKEG